MSAQTGETARNRKHLNGKRVGGIYTGTCVCDHKKCNPVRVWLNVDIPNGRIQTGRPTDIGSRLAIKESEATANEKTSSGDAIEINKPKSCKHLLVCIKNKGIIIFCNDVGYDEFGGSNG